MAKNQSVKTGKKLRGAVLIMVLTVSFMLIILLLATLTVVSTAQNRSYTKFEENQAYYSARSALDVYVNNMLADQTYAAVDVVEDANGKVTGGSKLTHKSADNSTDLAKFTQGYAMELDLYKIKAYAATYDDYLALSEAEKKAAPANTDYWVNSDSTVFADEPYKTDYGTPTEDFIEYEVIYPQIGNGSTDQHGKFVDNNSKAKIKVEVLARTMGGHDPAAAEADDKAAIIAESRSKDTMTIKVTSTATFGEYTATAVAIFDTVDSPSYFQDAVTCFGALPSTNNTSIIGGLSAKDPFTFRNNGVVYGGMYSKTSTFGDAHEYIYIDKEDSVYINQYTYDEGSTFESFGYDGTNYDEIPIIYFDNGVQVTGNVDTEFGDTSDMTDASKRVCTIINGNYSTCSSNTLKANGDVIITGDLVVNGMDFDISGSLIVLGNLKLTSNRWKDGGTNIGGGIIVGGTVDIGIIPGGNAAYFLEKIYTDNQITYQKNDNNTYNSASWNGITLNGYSSISDIKKSLDLSQITDETENGKEISLINVISLSGTTGGTGNVILSKGITRYIDTESSRFNNYLKPDGTIISAEEWAGTPSEADRKAGNFTVLNFSTPPAGAKDISSVISGGELTVSGTQDFILDTSSDLTITGSGTANIYVQTNSLPNNILVGKSASDRPKVNFYMPSGTYSSNNSRIWTYSIKDMFATGAQLKFGDGGNVKSPTIRIYLSAGTTWTLSNNNLIAAYVYGPDAKLDIKMGTTSSGDIFYNNSECLRSGTNVRHLYGVGIIGACVMKDIDSQNDLLYCYVKDDNSKDAGIPQLEWQAAEYRAS